MMLVPNSHIRFHDHIRVAILSNDRFRFALREVVCRELGVEGPSEHVFGCCRQIF